MTDPWVRSQRYSIDIAAVSIIEFVSSIGGWVFDHAMAGWDITALVEQPDSELRPAAILGARVADLETAVAEPQCADSYPPVLLVSAILYRRDPRIRGLVGRAIKHGDIAVFIWGGGCPDELLEQGCVTEYRCSTAGAIFKAHALRAATNPPQMRPSHTENFWALDVATRRALVHKAGLNVKAAR